MSQQGRISKRGFTLSCLKIRPNPWYFHPLQLMSRNVKRLMQQLTGWNMILFVLRFGIWYAKLTLSSTKIMPKITKTITLPIGTAQFISYDLPGAGNTQLQRICAHLKFSDLARQVWGWKREMYIYIFYVPDNLIKLKSNALWSPCRILTKLVPINSRPRLAVQISQQVKQLRTKKDMDS